MAAGIPSSPRGVYGKTCEECPEEKREEKCIECTKECKGDNCGGKILCGDCKTSCSSCEEAFCNECLVECCSCTLPSFVAEAIIASCWISAIAEIQNGAKDA